MELIIIFTMLILFAISIFDIETATIPHTLTILFLILGITYCFVDKGYNVWLPIGIFLGIFGLQFLLFCIYGENSIGGGDVKILSISALFLHSTEDVLNYCLLLMFFTLIGYVITKVKNQTHLRYGPYMALSIIGTLFININFSYGEIMCFSLIFAFIILCIDSIFFSYRRVIENVEENYIINQK